MIYDSKSQCKVEGCSERPQARWLCATHYGSIRSEGRLDEFPTVVVPRKPRRPAGERYMTRDGYWRIVLDNGAIVPEHRAVMEQMVGRPLVKGENVHHINGIRHDNRPENLELWVTTQPYGQRSKDVICPNCSTAWWVSPGDSEPLTGAQGALPRTGA